MADDEAEKIEEVETNDDISIVESLVDMSIQDRLWIRTLLKLIESRSAEPDASNRVQFAFDRMYIAACERLVRILESDKRETE